MSYVNTIWRSENDSATKIVHVSKLKPPAVPDISPDISPHSKAWGQITGKTQTMGGRLAVAIRGHTQSIRSKSG